jgi:hypothetical protein
MIGTPLFQSVIDVELEDGGWLEREKQLAEEVEEVEQSKSGQTDEMDEKSTEVFRSYLKNEFSRADNNSSGNLGCTLVCVTILGAV